MRATPGRSRFTTRAALVALATALLLTTMVAPIGASAAQPAAECALPVGGDAGAIDHDYYPRAVGTVKALMIFLDFPDAPAPGSTADTQTVFLPGAPDWFANASYGKLNLAVTTVPAWIRMPHASTSYGFQRDLDGEDHFAYIEDAVAAADPTVNFAGYELYYFVANREAAAISFSPAFIFSGGIEADGAEIRVGATFGRDAYNWGYKVLNHETGHDFGLPDLYAFEGDTHRFVGGWDLMGLISGLSPDYTAWSKWNLGWLTSAQISCLNLAGTAEMELTPLETAGGLKAVVLRTGPRTLTVAEYRTTQGTDVAACTTGVLIYTVNDGIRSGDGPLRVRDAHPGDVPGTCDLPLDDAAWGPTDAPFVDAATGITIQVLSTGATARVRVTRSLTWTPPDVRHTRTLTIRGSRSGASETFTGQLSASPAYTACRAARAVQLQKYVSGAWVTVRTANTSATGAWTYTMKRSAGKFRLVAASAVIGARPRHLCLGAASTVLTLR